MVEFRYRSPLIRASQAFSEGLRTNEMLRRGALERRRLEMGMQQVAEQQQEDADLKSFVSQNPDMDPDLASYKFYSGRNPEKAMEIESNIIRRADTIGDINPQAGVDYLNRKLGTNIEYVSSGKGIKWLNVGDRYVGLNDEGDEVRSINIKSDEPKIKTSMDAWLRDNPDATADEIFEQEKKYKVGKREAKYAPSTLKKMIDERQALIEAGATADDPRIKAYDNKLTGQDVDIDDMTPDEIGYWANYLNLSGKMPTLGRGKAASKIRAAIAKRAARDALGADADGVPDDESKTPAEAALDVVATQADTKAIQGSLNFLDKQLSSMGSFVTNLNSQIDRVGELAQDLDTFDTRLLNVPLRALRGRILGSPLQAKYDMFLSEIEAEIGKLATGSTGSVAELSATAQEKWSKIHDKNLSAKDMLSLLEETKEAANLRYQSVQDQLNKTRERIRTPGRQFAAPEPGEPMESEAQVIEAPTAAIEFLKANPQLKEQFRAKYGYLPEGF